MLGDAYLRSNEFIFLTADRRCDGLMVFVKEVKMRLKGPFELDVYANLTLDECQALCSRAEKYFCRSVEYDEQTHQCAIFEEDSISQRDDIGGNNSPTQHFYELVCLDNRKCYHYVYTFVYYKQSCADKSTTVMIYI